MSKAHLTRKKNGSMFKNELLFDESRASTRVFFWREKEQMDDLPDEK